MTLVGKEVCLLAMLLQVAHAQSANHSQVFEVASVKPSRSTAGGMRGGPGSSSPGQLVCTGVTLRRVLEVAYSVKPHQIVGPSTLDSERYDIVAKLPLGADWQQLGPMLQGLLADRFKLKLHRGEQEMWMYALLVGKNGPRLKAHEEDTVAQPTDQAAPAPPNPQRLTNKGVGRDGFAELPAPYDRHSYLLAGPGKFKLNASGDTMENFAEMLAQPWLSLPVVDMTGLKGRYDFTIYFAPENPSFGRGARGGIDPSPSAAEPVDVPTIFQAVDGLGLRLERKKIPVETLFVDEFQRVPTEN